MRFVRWLDRAPHTHAECIASFLRAARQAYVHFKHAAQSHNGNLDLDTFRHALRATGVQATPDASADLFTQIDTSGDGIISYQVRPTDRPTDRPCVNLDHHTITTVSKCSSSSSSTNYCFFLYTYHYHYHWCSAAAVIHLFQGVVIHLLHVLGRPRATRALVLPGPSC